MPAPTMLMLGLETRIFTEGDRHGTSDGTDGKEGGGEDQRVGIGWFFNFEVAGNRAEWGFGYAFLARMATTNRQAEA